MHFDENNIYHICNRGNNGEAIFVNHDNFLHFLWQMRKYLLPYGQLICYCLMMNHYHWQFLVERTAISLIELQAHATRVENLRRTVQYGPKAILKAVPITGKDKLIALGESIGILQRSYANAFNRATDRTGNLFQHQYHAEKGFIDRFLTVDDPYYAQTRDYPFTCFHYITDNARKAGMVKSNTDYLYSSARDYAGLRNGTICNLELGWELLRNF